MCYYRCCIRFFFCFFFIRCLLQRKYVLYDAYIVNFWWSFTSARPCGESSLPLPRCAFLLPAVFGTRLPALRDRRALCREVFNNVEPRRGRQIRAREKNGERESPSWTLCEQIIINAAEDEESRADHSSGAAAVAAVERHSDSRRPEIPFYRLPIKTAAVAEGTRNIRARSSHWKEKKTNNFFKYVHSILLRTIRIRTVRVEILW